jgi:hypothetical protein
MSGQTFMIDSNILDRKGVQNFQRQFNFVINISAAHQNSRW